MKTIKEYLESQSDKALTDLWIGIGIKNKNAIQFVNRLNNIIDRDSPDLEPFTEDEVRRIILLIMYIRYKDILPILTSEEMGDLFNRKRVNN